MTKIKSVRLRFFFTVLTVLIITAAGYLLYTTLRVRDLTGASHQLSDRINAVLFKHGISDADITRQYQRQMREKGREWIKYTKEIELPERKYDRILEEIRHAAGNYDLREIEKTPRKARVTVSEGPAAFADISFSFIPGKGLLAIIIDDLGYSTALEPFTSLNIPLTYAVIPGLGHSRSLAVRLREKNLPYIIHMPMEPEDSSLISDEPMLLAEMGREQIRAALQEALESVPGAEGLNNHMGSKFTAEKNAVSSLVSILKEKGLFAVDSKTAAGSVLYSLARQEGVPAAQNDFFIDNKRDYEYISDRLEKLTALAAGRQSTVAIGHIQSKNTAVALKEFIPSMKDAGITFVEVKEVLR